ncbi:MAG: flagellin [Silvanigrellales bacterium]|nr:flagellin [Silvanigrellales bacterium]
MMGLRITGNGKVEMNLEKARRDAAEILERLSSGVKFTRGNPMPAERAVSDSLSMRMRELSSYKRNANDGMSLVQTADSALSEVSNIVIRLKEISTAASSPTLSDQERKFLFTEYQSLYEEVDRISQTTTFNGMDLLNGNSSSGDDRRASIGIRVGAPPAAGEADTNVIRLDNLNEIKSNTETLGLRSVRDLLSSSDGISLDDVEDIFESTSDTVSSSFDGALERLAGYRSAFGAVSSRLTHVIDVIDIANENTASAQSRIRDVDYATEVSNLTRANILVQAGASLLAQGNVPAQVALTLINGLNK